MQPIIISQRFRLRKRDWRRPFCLFLLIAFFCRASLPLVAPISGRQRVMGDLYTILAEQYRFVLRGVDNQCAYVRFERAMEAIQRNRNAIETASARFSVPGELIAAVILKEQYTRSAPDTLVVLLAPFRGGQGSTGLGAVTARTARLAYAHAGESHRLPRRDRDVLRLFARSESEAVYAVASVLRLEADKLCTQQGLPLHQVPDCWPQILKAYNGRAEYARKTLQYIDDMRILLTSGGMRFLCAVHSQSCPRLAGIVTPTPLTKRGFAWYTKH